jgi:glycosyltransferase involved in cell wall biosynthesis
VITAARDEAHNLVRLADCLTAQTCLPRVWVIVENGSTDNTLEVATELSTQHDWVRPISVTGQSTPTRGGPIARAFEAGLETLEEHPDVVVIVDADVSMNEEYFERLMEKFAADPSIGMASGSRFEFENGAWRRHNPAGSTTVEGQCRAYRWSCLADVLPLDDYMGWDGIDAVKAHLRGWSTRTFPDFAYRHHRVMGARDGTRAKAWASEGRAAYYMGYRPYYLVLRALLHARTEPASVGLIWGYLREAARRGPRCPDRDVIDFVRSEQSIRNLPDRVREARGRTALTGEKPI